MRPGDERGRRPSGGPLVYGTASPAIDADALAARPGAGRLGRASERDVGGARICGGCGPEDKGRGGHRGADGHADQQAARQRTRICMTRDRRVDCDFMRYPAEDTAGWSRSEAAQLVAELARCRLRFDAVVANNDAMALGRSTLRAAGIAQGPFTWWAASTRRGKRWARCRRALAVTVFSGDADGRAGAALDAALALAEGETVPRKSYIRSSW